MNKRKITSKPYYLHIPGFPKITHKIVFKSLSSFDCKQLQKYIQELYRGIIQWRR